MKYALLILLLLLGKALFAHAVNEDLEKAATSDVIWFYLQLGIKHILPWGMDHILFVTALCLLNKTWKTALWQATAFTLAHSLTLALSMKTSVVIPADIVEPLIALSIVFVAVENILIGELGRWRLLLVFIFGLVHGLGFAAGLREIGLPRTQFLTSIISFNLGVELGQLVVILFCFLLVLIPFAGKPGYKKMVMNPLSILIGSIAAYWTIQRIFFNGA